MSDASPGTPSRAWSRPTAAAPDGQALPTDVATYGPGLPSEAELRLLGTLEGKRVLDLGCGAGHASVAFAKAGAKVIAVDPSAQQLEVARDAADRAGVRVELQHAGPAELAFVRGDSIDLAWSSYALAEVPDLDRVFRQVHRVLRPEAPVVFTLPHPAFTMFVAGPKGLEGSDGAPPTPRRTYHETATYTVDRGGDRVTDTPRTISTVFTALARTNFRVDHLLEPPARRDAVADDAWVEAMAWVPPTLIIRARKQGI